MERVERVLDKGYVELVDWMGSDEAIVQAARISTAKEGDSKRNIRGLIRFLLRNRHTTPFEQVTFKFRIKLPIFVARQLVRHRTQALNEHSLRYSEAEDEFYIPEYEDILGQGVQNKQGSEGELSDDSREAFLSELIRIDSEAHDGYQSAIAAGISRERARILLPVNLYTRWYSTISLWNLFHMLKLRMDTHSQQETREYAYAMYRLARQICPLAFDAFDEYILYSVTLSREDAAILHELLSWADQQGSTDKTLSKLTLAINSAKSSSQRSLRDDIECTVAQWESDKRYRELVVT